ncbi:Omp28-related outer membrane protein [uncultured Kordia sp.]|uniref:Omp28-related outer membrane protein n=1 Tax=uncultured Kordia sp. TaxID=507699 RepID=UPI00263306E1|nr:Omp28-related outer membrane protein [uncultured Kordia sp.]
MKTKNILKCLVAVCALFVYSCSSDSDGDGGTTPAPGGGGSAITSITVTASSNSVEVGNAVTFTVKGNDGTDVTSSSTISINNADITGSSFTASAPGTYTVKATYEQLTSVQLFIEVTAGPITALRVESATTSIKVGDTADFTVIGTDALGNEYTITSDASLSVNGTAITGNRFMATQMGDLTVVATKDAITSDDFMVAVTGETAPGTFAKNALIEDYTGTWCGWCPRVAYAIELVEAQSDRVFVNAVHSGDPMANSYGATLDNIYVTSGYPTAVLNRDVDWTYPEPSNVAQATNLATGTTTSGLSINSLLKGNQLDVYVSTAFAANAPGAKLVVMILEDGIVASQANYTSYYGAADPISQFVHNHTLRHSITNVLGDAIPNIAGGTKNEEVFSIPVPSTVNNANEMSILALIVAADGKVLNVNGAHVGVDKDFQAN